MNVNEALEMLASIDPESRDEIKLLLDCPHCGRSGELDSLRPMLLAKPATHTRSDLSRERTIRDTELRRIAMALGIPWPTTVEDIVTAIRVLPR